MIGPMLWLAAQAASAPDVEAELAAIRRQLPAAVEAWDLGRSDEDVARWKARLDRQLALWLAWREARCDPALLRYEGGGEAAPCRRRIGRVIAGDLRFRFGLAPGGRARASVEEMRAPAAPAASAEEEGPCADAPPAECDYCGMNRCWERRLRAEDRALNSAWRAALAKVGGRPALSAAQRADWAERLRKVQRLWLRWRDEACDLAAWETPNPYAHSIYALVTGPCLDAETRARTAALRRTYGPR
jgi:uncharacterized protein YecT (DUF1311 family)